MKYLAFLILSIILLLSGCIATENQINMKKTNIMEGKKILMIIAPENFRDEEFLEPKKVFENHGLEVDVASKGVSEAKGMLGARAKVDLDIKDVNAEDYEAIVFVGGSGSSIYYNDELALNIAREAFEKGKIVAAICIAPGILANAGILKGKKATIWDSGSGEYIDILEKGGAQYTGNDVERDGNIITANGPHAAREFGEKILEALS